LHSARLTPEATPPLFGSTAVNAKLALVELVKLGGLDVKRTVGGVVSTVQLKMLGWPVFKALSIART